MHENPKSAIVDFDDHLVTSTKSDSLQLDRL